MTDELKWHTPTAAPFRLAGFAWFGRDRIYRRLPVQPKEPLPKAVDALASNTAGGQIQFQTDSKRLSVRVKLAGAAGMVHMPATGQCGFDCYLGPPPQRYLNTAKYDLKQSSYEVSLFQLPTAEMRNVTLNFPLYMGVQEVSVGLEPQAEVRPAPPWASDRRVVVYGTSITQGGCASRPGMDYTNVLSRRLNVEFINLGFSGSGRGEPEVARTIAEIERVACFVLDYEGNSGPTEQLQKTFPEFIRILRAAHPHVPILVISRIAFAADSFNPANLQECIRRRDFQRDTLDRLRQQGDRALFFQDGSELLGEGFDECTVDGVHPNDLGFMRMADSLEPVLRKIVE